MRGFERDTAHVFSRMMLLNSQHFHQAMHAHMPLILDHGYQLVDLFPMVAYCTHNA